MIKKSLNILAILCTVSIYSIAQVNAMSLKDALSSSDIALDFGNGGTILCSYIDERSKIPDPGYINTKDYLFESNTYFIQSNILDLLTNTEGGGSDSSIVINSSLLGVNNISLQYSPSNNKVFDSITFTGDNSKYTGTFYLHPAIKNITFTKEESAISNISVQNTNQEQTAEQSITETNPRSLCIYLLENSYFNRLNINGNILLSFLNKHNNTIYLSFTKINNYSPYSLNVHDKVDIRINKFNYLGKKNLRSINITDSSSIEKPSTENNIETENGGIENIQEQIDTINNNINTINTTVGEDDTKGLRSRIKTVENSIGTVKTATEGESTSIVPLQNQITDMTNENKENTLANRIKVLESIDWIVKITELLNSGEESELKTAITSLVGSGGITTIQKNVTLNCDVHVFVSDITNADKPITHKYTLTNSNYSDFDEFISRKEIKLNTYWSKTENATNETISNKALSITHNGEINVLKADQILARLTQNSFTDTDITPNIAYNITKIEPSIKYCVLPGKKFEQVQNMGIPDVYLPFFCMYCYFKYNNKYYINKVRLNQYVDDITFSDTNIPALSYEEHNICNEISCISQDIIKDQMASLPGPGLNNTDNKFPYHNNNSYVTIAFPYDD